MALRQKVTAVATPGIHEDQADLTLTTTDGQVHHLFVEHAIGSLHRPLTDAELDLKVADLCKPVIGHAGAERLIAASRGLGMAASVTDIVAAAVPAGGR